MQAGIAAGRSARPNANLFHSAFSGNVWRGTGASVIVTGLVNEGVTARFLHENGSFLPELDSMRVEWQIISRVFFYGYVRIRQP